MALAFLAQKISTTFFASEIKQNWKCAKKCRILQIILKNGLMHKPSNFGFYCCPQKCLRNFMMKLSIVSSQVSSQKFYSKKVLPLPYWMTTDYWLYKSKNLLVGFFFCVDQREFSQIMSTWLEEKKTLVGRLLVNSNHHIYRRLPFFRIFSACTCTPGT